MPDSVTVADPPPLLVTVSTAFLTPGPVGANVTTAVVDADAASVVDAGAPTENCEASAPLMVSGVFSVIVVAVLLVSVTVCVAVAGAEDRPERDRGRRRGQRDHRDRDGDRERRVAACSRWCRMPAPRT